MGSIGLHVAKRLNVFGCIILYTSRNKTKPHVKFPFYPNVQQLAAKCEILII
ncbi:putative hydroxyphenylpyruvate reductase [Helianthus annuus]|uniref:Hydroxyphenylpyruvate reductase n=1 Tax=Helianthus annuus TaxID=4232 RepID=A0A9K3IC08_HELAN|nr:putative hydroxyphenylpyruvate reductase [Helianthus annuus]KAJ0900320.1 putative hydroxyphenylpyruvate reductase [Helianthus annuus]